MIKNPSYCLLIAAALLCACTRTERDSYEPDVRLSFDPILMPATRSNTADAFPVDAQITVDAWDYPIDKGLEAGKIFLPAAKVSYNGEEWLPGGDEVMWPASNRNLAVLASCPNGKALSSDLENGVHFRVDDILSDQTDLLYTGLLDGLNKKYGGVVDLPFNHALCYVDFAMRTNAREGETVEVTDVSLVSLATAGDFNSLKEPQWTISGGTKEVAFFSGSVMVGATNTAVGTGMWVIPQFVESEVKVSLEYTMNSGTFHLHEGLMSAKFRKRFLPGRHYTITLSFFPDGEKLILDESYFQSL